MTLTLLHVCDPKLAANAQRRTNQKRPQVLSWKIVTMLVFYSLGHVDLDLFIPPSSRPQTCEVVFEL